MQSAWTDLSLLLMEAWTVSGTRTVQLQYAWSIDALSSCRTDGAINVRWTLVKSCWWRAWCLSSSARRARLAGRCTSPAADWPVVTQWSPRPLTHWPVVDQAPSTRVAAPVILAQNWLASTLWSRKRQTRFCTLMIFDVKQETLALASNQSINQNLFSEQ